MERAADWLLGEPPALFTATSSWLNRGPYTEFGAKSMTVVAVFRAVRAGLTNVTCEDDTVKLPFCAKPAVLRKMKLPLTPCLNGNVPRKRASSVSPHDVTMRQNGLRAVPLAPPF